MLTMFLFMLIFIHIYKFNSIFDKFRSRYSLFGFPLSHSFCMCWIISFVSLSVPLLFLLICHWWSHNHCNVLYLLFVFCQHIANVFHVKMLDFHSSAPSLICLLNHSLTHSFMHLFMNWWSHSSEVYATSDIQSNQVRSLSLTQWVFCGLFFLDMI